MSRFPALGAGFYIRAALLIAAALSLLALPTTAHAAFPGDNGKIASFYFNNSPADGIYTVNPDGSAETRISNATGDQTPAWSPGGNKIAFTSLRDGDAEIYQ